ncbi:carbohydrate sulfotransferase 10 isoform X2 [Halichoeres trimaculatus]|uniref:carbohydrate sulfotransferase 10 isoform X2 n=1 Tax=Halichoeres trimaculatus TaxID=147232 RepID=UPI003D9F4A2B
MALNSLLFFNHRLTFFLLQCHQGEAMRKHWILLGACGWVVFTLMFVSKFISLRVIDEYGAADRCWTVPGNNLVKPIPVSSMEESAPQVAANPSDQLSDPTAADWQSVAESRIQLLSSMCKNSSLRNLTHVSISKFVLDRIFVCDKHKILFCQTPKVGNTQWKKVLIVLNGTFPSVEEVPGHIVHNQGKNGLPRLSTFTPQEITHRLSTYFKFFIVRDPFERLISAFKDKFVKNPRFEPWYKHKIAPAIIRKYRKRQFDSENTTSGLHFEDFVRYLGDVEGRHHLDRQFGEPIIHWMTYADLCAPCEIPYSVVGHHETLDQDAPFILRAAGIDQLVSYPPIPPGITRYNRTKVEQYFSGISKRDIRRLFARYQGDFSLFGYPNPDFLLN